MICTVTLNPLLEERIEFDNVVLGNVHRNGIKSFNAGGKGINVSRQLNLLGEQNIAASFFGGDNGKFVKKILKNENTEFTFTATKSNTRKGLVAFDKTNNTVTSFFDSDPVYTKQEVEDFKSKVAKTINNCSTVILSGSSPNEESDSVFPFLINLAMSDDKFVILDTYGKHLEACLNEAPSAIHINKTEVEKSLNVKLETEEDYIKVLSMFYKKGIKLAFITDGENDFYVSKYDFHYKVSVPKVKTVDSTGSGDAFTAGIAYGLEQALVFEDITKLCAKLGALNAASSKTAGVTKVDLENCELNVNIYPIGKKMKIIDDSPTI